MASIPDLDDMGLRQSLWAATAEPAVDCPPLTGESRTDVLVVGGGFAGLSAALHLAEKGVAVTVLEAVEPGWGASGRNGGQVIAGLKEGRDALEKRYGAGMAERMHAFCDRSADITFDLVERHGIACDAERGGWLQGAHGTVAAEELVRKAESHAGGDVAYLDAGETARLTGTDWYLGAYLDRRGGKLQPLSYARGLARAAIKAGAAMHGHSLVIGLSRVDGVWRAETESGAVCLADKVLLCTNGYSDLADPVPEITRSVVPFYSYQLATRPLSDNLRKSILVEGHCVSETRRVLSYYRLDAAGRFLMGARGAIDGSLNDAAFDLARQRLRELFPMLADEPLEHFWNGRVAITMDHLPRLFEPAPGLHALLGWSGRGVALTGAMGGVAADWLTGTAVDDLPMPVTPVRPIPFHGLRLIAARVLVGWNNYLDEKERRAAG